MTAVLLIGGSDSSGGAGLVRDVRTLNDLDVQALCAVTAVTAQTDAAVLASHVVPPDILRAQIEAAFASRSVGAVKIGMLACATTVRALAAALAPHGQIPVVLDPVLGSSSGHALLDAEGREALRARLLPRATLLTPNIPEAAALLGLPPAEEEAALLEQGAALLALGARAVLLKGGHAHGAQCVDLLLQPDAAVERLVTPRLSATLRGTGCALATAIAAHLARGLGLHAACVQAKAYVTALLQRSV